MSKEIEGFIYDLVTHFYQVLSPKCQAILYVAAILADFLYVSHRESPSPHTSIVKLALIGWVSTLTHGAATFGPHLRQGNQRIKEWLHSNYVRSNHPYPEVIKIVLIFSSGQHFNRYVTILRYRITLLYYRITSNSYRSEHTGPLNASYSFRFEVIDKRYHFLKLSL